MSRFGWRGRTFELTLLTLDKVSHLVRSSFRTRIVVLTVRTIHHIQAQLSDCYCLPHSRVVEPSTSAVMLLSDRFDISSACVEDGDGISFRAVGPVKANGVTVIAPSALASGLVVKAKKRGHWGRSGHLAWRMRDIVAVDGRRIPLRFEREAAGEGKGGEVATKTAVTGFVLLPSSR